MNSESLLLLILAAVSFITSVYNFWSYKQDMSRNRLKTPARKKML